MGLPKGGHSRLWICPPCWAGGHLLSHHPSPWPPGRLLRVLGGRPRWSRSTRTMLTRRGLCARSACCRSSPTPTLSGRSLSRSPGGYGAVGAFSFLDPLPWVTASLEGRLTASQAFPLFRGLHFSSPRRLLLPLLPLVDQQPSWVGDGCASSEKASLCHTHKWRERKRWFFPALGLDSTFSVVSRLI